MGWTTDPILCTGTFVRFVKRVEMRQLFGDRPGPLQEGRGQEQSHRALL